MLHVNIPALPSGHRLGFYFNDRELDRIAPNSPPPHQLSWKIEVFQEREAENGRPWYHEEIVVAIFDGNESSSISSQLKSTYSRMKNVVSSQRQGGNTSANSSHADHSLIATIRLPLRDVVWSQDAKGNLRSNSNSNSGGNSSSDSSRGGGKWYKIVMAGPNDSTDRFKGDYIFALMNLMSGGGEGLEMGLDDDDDVGSGAMGGMGIDNAISRLAPPAPNLMLCDILPPASPYFRHLYINFDSVEKGVGEDGNRSSSSTGSLFPQSQWKSHLPLVMPTYGEEILDMRENVQWRVAAGSNSFGDNVYILCKGLLLVTDLRVLFVPLFVFSSLWPNGAVLVPPEAVKGSVCSSSSPSSSSPTSDYYYNCAVGEGGEDVALLSTIKRYTFALPIPSVLECRCQPTPSAGSSITAQRNDYNGGAGDDTGGSRADAGSMGGSSNLGGSSSGQGGAPSGGAGYSSNGSEGLSASKEAVDGARSFLARADAEYAKYVTTALSSSSSSSSSSAVRRSKDGAAATDASSRTRTGSTDHLNYNNEGTLEQDSSSTGGGGTTTSSGGSGGDDPRRERERERIANSYNLVIIAKDGITTEFTVPRLRTAGCIMSTEEAAGWGTHDAFEDSEESSDDDDSENSSSDSDGGKEQILTSPSPRRANQSMDRGQPNPLTPPRPHTSVAKRLYPAGLSSQFVRPGVWCSRVRDTVMWLSCVDLTWATFALHMRSSVEKHVNTMERRAWDEEDEEEEEEEEDEEEGERDEDGEDDHEEEENDTGRDSSSVYEGNLKQLQRCLAPLSMEQDLQRMRVQDAGWRLSDLNTSYGLCDTYPHTLCFPEDLTDEDVELAAKQRSKNRLPALVWLHPFNKAALVRSSQPFTGVSGNRSNTEHDVKLCLAIKDLSLVGFIPATEDDHDGPTNKPPNGGSASSRKPPLRIADARPRLNANANALQGKGFESISQFGGAANATLLFMDIENIHVMRNSIARLREGISHVTWGWSSVLGGSSSSASSSSAAAVGLTSSSTIDTEVMSQSNWKTHIAFILKGAVGIAESISLGHPVLVHCSDGWDRTAQLSSLSQLLLDPYYRTVEGFLMLLEKEWCGFGHRMEGRLHTKSKRSTNTTKNPNKDDNSPVFIQYLDCVWQLQRQYPVAFEFSSHFLVVMVQSAQSGLFLSFRANCEKERTLLVRETVDKHNLRREQLFYSSFAIYARLLLYCPANRHQMLNILYQPPRPRDRKLQYLRPRCSGPHDLELWREGLCGFIDPTIGVLHDPCSELLSLDEWQMRILGKELPEHLDSTVFSLSGSLSHLKGRKSSKRSVVSEDADYGISRQDRCREVSRWVRGDVVETLVEDVMDMDIRYLCLEQRAQRHLKRMGLRSPQAAAAVSRGGGGAGLPPPPVKTYSTSGSSTDSTTSKQQQRQQQAAGDFQAYLAGESYDTGAGGGMTSGGPGADLYLANPPRTPTSSSSSSSSSSMPPAVPNPSSSSGSSANKTAQPTTINTVEPVRKGTPIAPKRRNSKGMLVKPKGTKDKAKAKAKTAFNSLRKMGGF